MPTALHPACLGVPEVWPSCLPAESRARFFAPHGVHIPLLARSPHPPFRSSTETEGPHFWGRKESVRSERNSSALVNHQNPTTVRSSILIGLFSLSFFGCDVEEGAEDPYLEVEEEAVQSEDASGEDGSMVDSVEARDESIPDLRIGTTVWEYVGQQSDRSPRKHDRQWRMESPEDAQDDDNDVESLLRNTTRVDSEGRVWAFKALDRDALQRKLDESYEAQLRDGFDAEELRSPELGALAEVPDRDELDEERSLTNPDDEDGTAWLPMTWINETCVNNPWPQPDVKIARWDADSRVQINNGTLLGRASGAVIVASFDPATNTTSANCSGVMVGDSWVLTAAHCVADNSGIEDPPGFIRVAAGGGDHPSSFIPPMYTNFDGWHGVEAIHTPSQYNGNNINRDYALLHLSSPISPNLARQMRFSGASQSAWENSTPHNISYPGFGVNCASNVFPGQALVGTPSGLQFVTEVSQRAFRQKLTGGVNFVSGSKIGTNLDSVGGQSGSPIYRCGGGSCQNGETAWIMGVLTSRYYQNFAWHNGGPNANQFRDWAMALIDD